MPTMTSGNADNTFAARVKHAIKGLYHSSMRRTLQSIALYEADRCLNTRYASLRPFQRKHALLATAVDLLKALDFLNEYHVQEIMFRTNASKEPLAPDLAWRRMKLISREINQTVLPKAKDIVENDENREKSHDEICEMILQAMYEDTTENAKEHPPMWEYNHNNTFTVYRIYFRGIAVDPSIFPAIPPRVVQVPTRKPADGGDGEPMIAPLSKMTIGPGKIPVKGCNTDMEIGDVERRAMLKEVKEHTELLKEFEGVIPDEDLVKRKRALYAALPPVPSPFGMGTKQRKKTQDVAPPAISPSPPVAVSGPLAPKLEDTAMEENDWEKLGAQEAKQESPKNAIAV